MGFISFLGVVLFCLVILFLWSRGKDNTKSSIEVEYVPRKEETEEASPTEAPIQFNMKIMWTSEGGHVCLQTAVGVHTILASNMYSVYER